MKPANGHRCNRLALKALIEPEAGRRVPGIAVQALENISGLITRNITLAMIRLPYHSQPSCPSQSTLMRGSRGVVEC